MPIFKSRCTSLRMFKYRSGKVHTFNYRSRLIRVLKNCCRSTSVFHKIAVERCVSENITAVHPYARSQIAVELQEFSKTVLDRYVCPNVYVERCVYSKFAVFRYACTQIAVELLVSSKIALDRYICPQIFVERCVCSKVVVGWYVSPKNAA